MRNRREFWWALYAPWPPKTEFDVDWRHQSAGNEISEILGEEYILGEKRGSRIQPLYIPVPIGSFV